MAPHDLKVFLALLSATCASSQSTVTVWSSFAYIFHGERTPIWGPAAGHASLTPYGAQQLYAQGSVFRDRYLSANTTLSDEENEVTKSFPIVGVERNALDNSQLSIFSTADDFVTGGALAFMQGLYPPITQAFAYNNGGMNASVLANGSLVNYPLEGYQYPNIQSMSTLEPSSIWLDGHVTCTEWWKSANDFKTNPASADLYNQTYSFYKNLWSTTFADTIPMTTVTLDHAYDLYDYARYQYNHNETIRETLSADELNILMTLAGDHELSLNGNLSVSGLKEGDMIRAIAGRTLAGKIIAQFQAQIASGGYSNKMSLIFGSYEPMLAFFALSDLSDGHASSLFTLVPEPGSAMVFELFSVGNDSSSYPVNEDLWIRFLYRSGTNATAPFVEYPLFGLGNSQARMRYHQFRANMLDFAVTDTAIWCDTCGSVTSFCAALEDISSSSESSQGNTDVTVSPTVAGVIGAVVAMAIFGLVSAAAIVFGGLRIRRVEPVRKNSLGGFKGAEKMASDLDVAIVKSGARHERVGSWELGGSGGPGPNVGAGTAKDGTTFGAIVTRHDDADSIMNQAPTKPRESV
ncbi:histidine phosphatase superfamily [Pseudomassariella vexata]|uniref:Histidine phosphatase superfamily n=1 Tax=Pseudomassariella vexata TaxID=1141098 RepID=A0A1Y2DC50_9PEZI|nr:histidine phosphatase superfamily [Pseudomassariella vexata]ORY56838.1 histidine phosphatase superfamily [Pseudomassariella vexata]